MVRRQDSLEVNRARWFVAGCLYTVIAIVALLTFASKQRYTEKERSLMRRGHLGA